LKIGTVGIAGFSKNLRIVLFPARRDFTGGALSDAAAESFH
jgi:hypothetical protein